ncbi:hypothetical protein [Geodermatophilus sp. URMC 64]
MNIVAKGRGLLTASDLRHHLVKPPSSGPRRRRIDLARATFADPAGLVALAAIAERAHIDRVMIEFTPPSDQDCAVYLSRMRLGQHLRDLGVDHGLPTVHENPLGDRLHELTRFSSEEEFDQLAATVERTFEKEHPGTARDLYRALHEVASNVLEHSGRSGGYLALQRFPQRNDVAFAVADSGIGLRGSLSKRMTVDDDRTALVRAVQVHVTSLDAPGRGRGLGRVIATTGHHHGAVLLLSGSSQGVFTGGHFDPWVADLAAPFPGTLAQARLHL